MRKTIPLHTRLTTVIRHPLVLLFIILLLLGIFFRFFNTPDRFGFDKDPTRDGLVTLHGARELVFPLIGPHSGVGGFTFGPWYYYSLILFTLVFPMPFAPYYFIPIYSLAFIFVMYLIGRELKDAVLGTILAGFAALTPSQIGPTAGLSNPNLVSVPAALTVLLFIMYVREKQHFWFSFLWGIILGIGINHHFQSLPLLLLPFIAYGYRWQRSARHILVFILGVALTFMPLLVFNITNEYHTVQGFLGFLGGEGTYVPNSWTIYVKDFWPAFWAYLFAVPLEIGIAFAILVVSVHLYAILSKKLPVSYSMLLGMLIGFVLLLRYVSGSREYYYYFFLHPLLFLIAGFALWMVWQFRIGKAIVFLLSIVMLLFSFQENYERVVDRPDFLSIREQAHTLMAKYPDATFQLYNCQDMAINRAEGIAYFLEREQKVSPTGKVIAFAEDSDACHLPAEYRLIADETYEFTGVSRRELTDSEWKVISAEAIYQETVNWWQSENAADLLK